MKDEDDKQREKQRQVKWNMHRRKCRTNKSNETEGKRIDNEGGKIVLRLKFRGKENKKKS